MVYFEINQLGFNCGISKSKCAKYPKYCMTCLKKKLKELGFEIDSNLEIFELDSYERHLQVEREIIWQKFLDVLNIRHIIIMDKESGLKILNYSVSGAEIDADLLSGFIQANITFSESDPVSSEDSKYTKDHQFYEFQYQNFNILLKNGEFIRLCLILDQTASNNIRSDVRQFLFEYEDLFHDKIDNFKNSGIFDTENMFEYLIDFFNIKLVFPMTLAHIIAPNDVERINQNQIQKAVLTLAREILTSKPFFFMNNLLNRVKKIVNLDAKIILYEINQLVENNIFVSTNLEKTVSNIEMIEETASEKTAKSKPISSLITSSSGIEDLQLDLDDMNVLSASKMLKKFVKKAKETEKALVYQDAKKEYKKALLIARKFNLKEDIDKISESVLSLEKKEKQLELDFILEAGEHAEKNGDYLNSINYYQKALKILESFLIFNISDSRIKKLKKKIMTLREEI